jgi:hypothetical protein
MSQKVYSLKDGRLPKAMPMALLRVARWCLLQA